MLVCVSIVVFSDVSIYVWCVYRVLASICKSWDNIQSFMGLAKWGRCGGRTTTLSSENPLFSLESINLTSAFSCSKGSHFLVPVSRPVHFEGVKNHIFFFWTCDI